MSPDDVDRMRSLMREQVGPVAHAAPDARGFVEAPDRKEKIHSFMRGLSLKEKVEVAVICELTESYFAIVKKNFTDVVPKAVTHKLVDATTDLAPEVLAALNTDETVAKRMGTSDAVARTVADTEKAVAALSRATNALADVKVGRL